MRWQPYSDLAYSLSAAGGDAGSSLVIANGSLPDPRSLTFDCARGTAIGNVPATNADRQRSSAVRATVERSGRRGRLVASAWSQSLQNAPVMTAVDNASFPLPAGYASAVAAIAGSPFICGSGIANLQFVTFQPANQRNRGVNIGGTLQVGTAMFAGFATVQSRVVTGGTGLSAATPLGVQVPETPLHRAGFVATAKLGRSVDVMANLSYTGANNPNRLPAYTLLNAGLALPLSHGSLALIGTNLTNRFASTFGSVSAGAFGLPSIPLRPRTALMTYTVRAGRLGEGGNGAGTREAAADEGPAEGQHMRIAIRATNLPETPPANALTIDPDNEECSPVAAREAQRFYDAIGAISAAAERLKTGGRYPATLAGVPASAANAALRYTPYEDGARFAVVATARIPAVAPLLNCSRLHTTTSDEAAKRHLLWPEGDAQAFTLVYSRDVGIYFLPPAQMRGGAMIRAEVAPLPATPPADPFALRAECPASAKPIISAIIGAVRAAREAMRSGAPIAPSDVAAIAAHGGTTKWLAIAPADELARGLTMQCLHVAGAPRARLVEAGIDDTRRAQSLGFTDRFGFYVIAGQ